MWWHASVISVFLLIHGIQAGNRTDHQPPSRGAGTVRRSYVSTVQGEPRPLTYMCITLTRVPPRSLPPHTCASAYAHITEMELLWVRGKKEQRLRVALGLSPPGSQVSFLVLPWISTPASFSVTFNILISDFGKFLIMYNHEFFFYCKLLNKIKFLSAWLLASLFVCPAFLSVGRLVPACEDAHMNLESECLDSVRQL